MEVNKPRLASMEHLRQEPKFTNSTKLSAKNLSTIGIWVSTFRERERKSLYN